MANTSELGAGGGVAADAAADGDLPPDWVADCDLPPDWVADFEPVLPPLAVAGAVDVELVDGAVPMLLSRVVSMVELPNVEDFAELI